MEHQDSSLCSQKPASGPAPEPDGSSPESHRTSSRFTLTLLFIYACILQAVSIPIHCLLERGQTLDRTQAVGEQKLVCFFKRSVLRTIRKKVES
jgi:hypothetical protein